MEKEEIWFDLLGYETYYQISNLGRFKSKERNVKGKNNSIIKKPSRVLKIKIHTGGYNYVQTCINSKEKNLTVHRYIAMHFIPNPENKPFINHINGVKTDNRVENLEWCTAKENMRHAYDTGLEKGRKGVEHHKVKLTEKQVLIIRERCLLEDPKILAKEFLITPSTISAIKNRKTWKHI